MANKPLTLSQITSRIESLESELAFLKSEVQKLKPKSQEMTPTISPTVSGKVETKEILIPHLNTPKPSFISRWESFLGENLFIKLGLLTMLLGAIWFINFALEEYWINESVRIWFGILVGLGVFIQGTRLLKSWPLIGPSLVGTGASLLFISYFLGYFAYDLYSMKLTFVGLVFLSFITVSYSYILRNEVIFGFGMLGAFLIPALLSTGENSYQFLFIYLILWNLVFLFLSSRMKWRISPLVLLFGNHLMFGGWASEKLEVSTWQIPLLFQIVIFVIFLVREHILVPREKETETILSTVTIGFTLLFAYLQAYYISSVFFPLFQNSLLIGFVVIYFAFLLRSFQKSKITKPLSDLFFIGSGLLGILFLLVTLVLGFEGRTLSIVVLSFALLIGTVGAKTDQIGLYALALIFWAVSILNLIFANRWPGEDGLFLVNGFFLLFLFASALIFYLSQIGKKHASVADIYKWAAFPVLLAGSWLDVYYHLPESYRILGYTAFLAFYGLSFTGVSFIYNKSDLRKIGLVCLILVVLKLYLYDFWNMGILARIFAGFGLGAALVATGIFYNRSKKINSQPKD